MKTLLLMRHAKSDWDADYESDHDRPLNDRGLKTMERLIRAQRMRAESTPGLSVSA